MSQERGESFRTSSLATTVAFFPIVSDSDRYAWNKYSQDNQAWLQDSYPNGTHVQKVPSDIWSYPDDNSLEGCDGERRHLQKKLQANVPADSGPYAPLWQISPPLPAHSINFNILDKPFIAQGVSTMLYTREPAFISVCRLFASEEMETIEQVAMVAPVFDNFADKANIVGHYIAVLDFQTLLSNILEETSEAVTAVMKSTCGNMSTYAVQGEEAHFVSSGDFHDTNFDSMNMSSLLIAESSYNSIPATLLDERCIYSVHTYPTAAFQKSLETNVPAMITVGVVAACAVLFLTFLAYDFMIQRRQLRVVKAVALKHEGLVSSLFPENVRKQVLLQAGEGGMTPGKMDGVDAPIADLYLNCTVLFADIAGFTAWSSTREPAQVFVLLETIYSAFDEIAKQRGVFKIETIGDCYVAVTGLPRPRKDHFVAMSRFARDCVSKFQVLTQQLEITLGPDTADLALRVGIHSGPVTAGVLRGDKARFQLFGDTVNTTARIESTGSPNRIHLSEEAANLLIAAGKQHWVEPRDDVVEAKGKGQLRTYWLVMQKDSDTVSATSSDKEAVTKSLSVAVNQVVIGDVKKSLGSSRTDRLIEWNCDILLRLLKQVIARRNVLLKRNPLRKADADENRLIAPNMHVIDEVQEIIEVPNQRMSNLDYESIVLPKEVVDEMYDYVSNIAAMYHDNPFHNFEHASHVAMSVTKLLSRIVAPSDVDCSHDGARKNLHDHTYGITSDPLTHLACVYSALIHDVDHSGVPNSQLVKEKSKLADFYKGRSIAEQNSVDLGWALLMDDRYSNLRRSIYTTRKGLERFRHLVVNSVVATDIMDRELAAKRKERWVLAFEDVASDESVEIARNRKATIVIEHLIQASDVAHTMQHWHIYRKWNERLFEECWRAWKDGRSDSDPSHTWYKGEIGFFDFYIIPLAKKLKDCGVFGKSSDEYLNYAETNRREWELKGEEIVSEMVRRVNGG
ncbi:hypothetical protein MPSEU_000529800 [Mayamaea pseudoterrestris]|nr:hypothetical protein MPSEU_000529800 [Mayamaea pseudoterrestris]